MDDLLQGSVLHIVFAQEDTGFTVAKLTSSNSQEIVITGVLSSIQPGEYISCRGRWTHHPQHGRQFHVNTFECQIPSDLIGIQKYLESGMIRGIGPAYAQRIVKKFGLSTLDVIDQSPHLLKEVGGIGAKRLEKIISCWQEQKQIRDVMIFLRKCGISSAYAHKIYRTYGDLSIEKVKANPFALAKDIYGIGFKTADKIATSLAIPFHSPMRIDAGIEYVFRELSQDGHTCYPKNLFDSIAANTLQVDPSLVHSQIQNLLKQENLFEKKQLLFLKLFYLGELSIAREVWRLCDSSSSIRKIDMPKAIEWVQVTLRLCLAKEQISAVEAGLREKILIITGGPGTGKSTITKAILRVSEKLTPNILLAAPTGRAAKRMSEITHKKAWTIHSLLEMDFTTKRFKKNRDNPLLVDLMILDEVSMIDTLLMADLLRALPSSCRLILIGDVDQLPSVGAGSVLKDLINSEKIPTFYLKKIFRQSFHSKIVTNAHKINDGIFPDINTPPDSDFLFIEKQTPEEILEEIERQICHILPLKGFPINKAQVLSPMKRGIIGTENLNIILQRKLITTTQSITKMGRTFFVGDKIMQTKNNYQKHVYNGDIGTVSRIDSEENRMFVRFDEMEVAYEFYELDELTLAYAVSIHKYQGSECDCIVMPIHTTHFTMLSKNILYTGITRGKKLVILIGTKKALAIAVKNKEVTERYTFLKQQIQQF